MLDATAKYDCLLVSNKCWGRLVGGEQYSFPSLFTTIKKLLKGVVIVEIFKKHLFGSIFLRAKSPSIFSQKSLVTPVLPKTK
jgi:hypothetical protein